MHTNHNIPYFSIIVSILVLTSCASAVDDPDVCRTMNLVYCDGICADPMTSPKYCGANDSCSDYTSCNSDEYCTEGHCKKVATETHDESGTCADFKKYCKNNSIIGCINGNITVEEFCTGSTPVCDPHTVTCTALPEAVCTDGDFKCESNVPSVCIGNTWHTKSLCAKGTYCNSLSGECTSGPVELDPEESCETDSVRCENNVPVVCSESRWILREKCDDDSYCNSMTAHCDKIETLDCNETPDDPQCTAVQPPTPVCSNNEQRCFYGKIQQCQDNEWTDLASCESGKCANEKDCEQLVCHTGDTQCSDAILQMCADNAWLDVLECPSGICKDGKCIESQQTTKTVVCNGEQIDPMTSDNYCGADDECLYYSDCTIFSGQICHKGSCKERCYYPSVPKVLCAKHKLDGDGFTRDLDCSAKFSNRIWDILYALYNVKDNDYENDWICLSPDEMEPFLIWNPNNSLVSLFASASAGKLVLPNVETIPMSFYINYLYYNYHLPSSGGCSTQNCSCSGKDEYNNNECFIPLSDIILPDTKIIKKKAFYTSTANKENYSRQMYTNNSYSNLNTTSSSCSNKIDGINRFDRYHDTLNFHLHYFRFKQIIFPKVQIIEEDAFATDYIFDNIYTSEISCPYSSSYRCITYNRQLQYIAEIQEELFAPELEKLEQRGLYAVLAKKYYFPKLTFIGTNSITVSSLYSSPEIYITSPEDITLKPDWIVNDRIGITASTTCGTFQGCCVDKVEKPLPVLYVNSNKAPGGTGSPTVDIENKTWGGEKFQQIIFVD